MRASMYCKDFNRLTVKWLEILIGIFLISSCGGGGGGSAIDTTSSSDAIQLRANLASAAFVTLTNSSTPSSTLQTSSLSTKDNYIKKFFDLILPSAFAVSGPFNNVLAFDANGNTIANPLVTNVNVFIGAVTVDPTGTYIYLWIEDHQNTNMYADYRALKGSKCSLYRVKKSTGEVSCLANTEKYDLYNPSTNQAVQGNASESFIKFDTLGNGYLIMFDQQSKLGSGGTEKQRLVKIDNNGALSTVRDSSTGYARGLVYAKNGKFFYKEDSFFSASGSTTASYIFDPADSSLRPVNTPVGAGALIASDITGEVYVSTGNTLYRLNQTSMNLSRIYSGGDPIVWLLRSPSGGIYTLQSSGDVHSINLGSRNLITGAGAMPPSRAKNDISDLSYPPLSVSGEYIIVKGTDLDGVGQFCAARVSDKAARCFRPTEPTPIFLSTAVVGAKGYAFYESGAQNRMMMFDLSSFIDGTEPDPVGVVSPFGDGSIVAALSVRPPISFVADLSKVTTSTADKIVTVATPVTDSYTYLSFTSTNGFSGLSAADLALKDSTGAVVDAVFKIVDKAIYATIRDTSGQKSSGYKSLGTENNYSLIFPNSFPTPTLTRGIGTKSGYFPIFQQISVLSIYFSAPVANMDVSNLRLTDAGDVLVPADISLTGDGMTLEVRVIDSSASNLTGYKKIPPDTIYKIVLPDRVRLPGQTFLSPFDKTSQVITTKS